jgi:hypothetical protein
MVARLLLDPGRDMQRLHGGDRGYMIVVATLPPITWALRPLRAVKEQSMSCKVR